MISSDILVSTGFIVDSFQEDEYILVWAGDEILTSFYAENVSEAEEFHKEHDMRTGLRTKLYMKVKT